MIAAGTGRAAAFACLAMILFPAALLADEAGKAIGVEVRIGAVLASNHGNEFDHRLTGMRRQFDNLFSYSSYRLVKEQRKRVPWGSNAGFDVPGGPYVLVIPREYKNDRVFMKVVVIEDSKPIVDTLLALRDQGTFIVGGRRHSEGVLILTIGADLVR
jgi:hypothetical protein